MRRDAMLNTYSIEGNQLHLKCLYKSTETYTVIADMEDFDRINSIEGHWSVALQGSAKYLRARQDGRVIWLHLYLVGDVPEGKIVDHIDRDTMNHCRSNLRVASRRVNAWNTKTPTKTGERCIQIAPNGKFRVRIGIGSREIKQIGTYNTIEEAVIARDEFLIERNL